MNEVSQEAKLQEKVAMIETAVALSEGCDIIAAYMEQHKVTLASAILEIQENMLEIQEKLQAFTPNPAITESANKIKEFWRINTMRKPKFETPDLTSENIEKIAALFPNCITEMPDEERSTPEKKVYKRAVNFELLKQMLSPDVVDGDEAYEFTWVGKKAAIVEANKPIRKTLRPCVAESKDWDTTENLYIEGDNLEVLKLLQESYLGKVKMIYIDPPYNTGNDFIYADDFKMESEEWKVESGEWSEEGDRLFKNTDTNGRFHSDWCSMIYSRLLLARNLLTDDGVIFISIDDNEQENLKKICDEVFGGQNFVAQLVWERAFSPKMMHASFRTVMIMCLCTQRT